MKITFAVVGKTTDDYLKKGEKIFFNRLKYYVNINITQLPQAKKHGGFSPAGAKII